MAGTGILDEDVINLSFWTTWPRRFYNIRAYDLTKDDINSNHDSRITNKENQDRKAKKVNIIIFSGKTSKIILFHTSYHFLSEKRTIHQLLGARSDLQKRKRKRRNPQQICLNTFSTMIRTLRTNGNIPKFMRRTTTNSKRCSPRMESPRE